MLKSTSISLHSLTVYDLLALSCSANGIMGPLQCMGWRLVGTAEETEEGWF